MKLTFYAFVLVIVFVFLKEESAAQRLGDSGWIPDTSKFSIKYPDMGDWASAGVKGGIPLRANTNIIKTIFSGHDLQNAINEVNALGGGVLLLKNGLYPIDKAIWLKSNVILRGENQDQVILQVRMHNLHFSKGGKDSASAALFGKNVHHVGIEDLTVKYTGVNFEPFDRNNYNYTWTDTVYHRPERRDTTLFVNHIQFDFSENCWIDHCKLLWAGNDVVKFNFSKFCTVRDNFIDRCYNKNDGGMGYFNITYSDHILVLYNTIKRIRHFAIHKQSKFIVAFRNHFEVDVNFHDGDYGHSLIEQDTIRIPVWHSWHPYSHGDASKHHAPGSGNILVNNKSDYKNTGPEYGASNVVYYMNPSFASPKILTTSDPLPSGGQFYAVKRQGSILGIKTSIPKIKIEFYPNPATSTLSFVALDKASEDSKLFIINSLGQIKETYNTSNEPLQIDVSTWPSGMYYIRHGQIVQKCIIQSGN